MTSASPKLVLCRAFGLTADPSRDEGNGPYSLDGCGWRGGCCRALNHYRYASHFSAPQFKQLSPRVSTCIWWFSCLITVTMAGANLMVNCWGPVLGAKVVSYRTALILGVICQSAGALAFGAEKYTVFGDLLQQWTKLEPYPRLTAYSLMWIVAVPVVWQVLAVWQAVPVPAYLGTGWSDCIILVHAGCSYLHPNLHCAGKHMPVLALLLLHS